MLQLRAVMDIIYVGELETYTVLTYHCASYSVWPSLLLILLYLALNAKTLDTSVVGVVFVNGSLFGEC